MAKKNANFAKLPDNYLFPEIQRKKEAYLDKFPNNNLISLGIGDTTQPLSQHITDAICEAAQKLATPEGYSGYGPEQGCARLRRLIAETFYAGMIQPDEIFVTDGAKCDTGRLLHLFGSNLTIAVQDPAYPVYVDTSIICGQSHIVYMPCLAENDFFPDLDRIDAVDLIFFCSPNNPTGSVATREQLQRLVAFALERQAFIIFDSAYSFFITEDHLPRSIYEIAGAEKVAIEIGSFSKLAGFTGLRLSWSVVPKAVLFGDGSSAHQAWNRIITTFFNGASTLSQAGGIAALQHDGLKDLALTRDFYLENASLIRETFESLGFKAYGGTNSPYIWVNFSPGTSWEMFDEFLSKTQIITTPGSGFGPSGEGYLRFSAFAPREAILESMARVSSLYTTATLG